MAKKSNKLNKSDKRVGQKGFFEWLGSPIYMNKNKKRLLGESADIRKEANFPYTEVPKESIEAPILSSSENVGAPLSTGLPSAPVGGGWNFQQGEMEKKIEKLPKGVTYEKEMMKAREKQRQADKFTSPFENIKVNDAITLGLAGVDAFLRRNEAIRNNYEFNKQITDNFQQYSFDDYNVFYGPDASGGTQYQNIIMAEKGANIRKGTSPMGTDVEVEGGEFIQLPDGNTQHVQGPSHAKGGVHTNLPEGTRVFSDFLKPMGSKKTYAQLAKKYDTDKWKSILENAYANEVDRKTAKLMFDRYESVLNDLFQDQQLQNGNSDGTDQAAESMGMAPEMVAQMNQEEQAVGKFGLDLKEGEKLSFTNPFEYGGQYYGGYAEFQDGGQFPMMGEDASTYYMDIVPPSYDNDGFYDVSGKANFQVGGTAGATTQTTIEDPNQTVTELEQKILGSPELQQAFLAEYKKLFPNSPANLTDLINSLKLVTSNISQIRSKATQDELKDVNLDKGNKNAKYKELAKKYGVDPIKDENLITRFQGVYRTLASLQGDQRFAPLLQEYELTPIGVDDTKWQGSLYSGKGISEADGWFGNTTIGQLVRKKTTAPVPTTPPAKKEEPPTPYTPPKGNEMPPTESAPDMTSTLGAFPAYQAAPNVLGYLAGMNPYSYYTPDFKPAYIVPPTLNIDSELQSIDDSFASAIRQSTGNPSLDNSRNAALYTATLDAKQKAFQTKQNYDAQARFEADKFNALSTAEANNKNVLAAAQVKNEYMAASQDLAETERLNSIFNLTDKVGKYYQDEYAKALYLDALIPGYYYDGRDRMNPIKRTPGSNDMFASKFARTYNPYLKPESAATGPTSNANINNAITILQGNQATANPAGSPVTTSVGTPVVTNAPTYSPLININPASYPDYWQQQFMEQFSIPEIQPTVKQGNKNYTTGKSVR